MGITENIFCDKGDKCPSCSYEFLRPVGGKRCRNKGFAAMGDIVSQLDQTPREQLFPRINFAFIPIPLDVVFGHYEKLRGCIFEHLKTRGSKVEFRKFVFGFKKTSKLVPVYAHNFPGIAYLGEISISTNQKKLELREMKHEVGNFLFYGHSV